MGLLRPNPYREIEKLLGYRFRKRDLLEEALVHRSYRFENPETEMDNQRLEFLGDSALGLAAAVFVFDRYSDRNEGFLTAVRSRLASGKMLARIAERIGLGKHLRLGKGEEQSGGRTRGSNLADALEAVIGAIYLDGGMRAVDRLFAALFVPELDESAADVWAQNPKGRLQQLCQARWKESPVYRMVEESGPQHSKEYRVEVRVGDRSLGVGSGNSKQRAESAAATAAVAALESAGVKSAAQNAFHRGTDA